MRFRYYKKKFPGSQLALALLFVLSGISQNVTAQLCEGSLGDPVVNITFGSGTNPGPSLGNLTNYNYVANDCPEDGSYTIENNTNSCFQSTWHSVRNHTPNDPNGYMMVVNASYNPGDFFVQPVSGLCGNTTYEFAAWIYNVLYASACNGNGIKPNITFSIETLSGTVLKSYQTGDIASEQGWKQYGFYFATPPDIHSVMLRMTNNAPGGCGNDLLLDDITFRPCGPFIDATISGASDSVDACEGDAHKFTLIADVSSGYIDPAYQWQESTDSGKTWVNIAGDTTKNFVRQPTPSAGLYLYRFAVAQRMNLGISSCAVYSNVVSIAVNKYPDASVANKGSCVGDSILLTANGGSQYAWTGPAAFSSTEQSPVIATSTAANEGNYYVKVISDKGCITTDSTRVQLVPRPEIKAGSDAKICQGSTVQLNATGTHFTSLAWTPARGISDSSIANPVARPDSTTEYVLTAYNGLCKSTDSLLIDVDMAPLANAGPDKTIVRGQTVVLEGSARGTDVSFSWSPSFGLQQADSLHPAASPAADQLYVLTVESNAGCGVSRDSVVVKVYKQLYIPNAFTPNNDGINDTWNIETLAAYPGAVVKVYNRVGQLVFDNDGSSGNWDGKFHGKAPQAGAYVYIIDLKNGQPVIKGTVYIIL